jgi:hypothetical protein
LSWTTASEINNSHFELLRFGEGSEEVFIGEVLGNGNSSSQLDYEFVDRTPIQGWNYYRLLQYDFDGTVSDEGVVSVLWDDTTSEFEFNVQSISSGLVLKFNSISGPYSVQLFDKAGREIFQTETNSNTIEIPMSNSQGVYVLRVDNGQRINTKKIVWVRP